MTSMNKYCQTIQLTNPQKNKTKRVIPSTGRYLADSFMSAFVPPSRPNLVMFVWDSNKKIILQTATAIIKTTYHSMA